MIPFEEINQRIWSIGAEIFTPCAASRLVTQSQIDSLIATDLKLFLVAPMFLSLIKKFSLDQ
jgi:glutamate dehydrogenase/leucine dehydrogenase